jgi:hypothetical protein
MTLAASAAVSFLGSLRSWTRLRYRWLCRFRFCLPLAVARYFSRDFHPDQARAACRHCELQ